MRKALSLTKVSENGDSPKVYWNLSLSVMNFFIVFFTFLAGCGAALRYVVKPIVHDDVVVEMVQVNNGIKVLEERMTQGDRDSKQFTLEQAATMRDDVKYIRDKLDMLLRDIYIGQPGNGGNHAAR